MAKHRNGPTDTITVAFQGHYSRFVNMAATNVHSVFAIKVGNWISRRSNFCCCFSYIAGTAGAAGASYCYHCEQVASGIFPDAVQNSIDGINRHRRRNAVNRPFPLHSGKKLGTTSISIFDQNAGETLSLIFDGTYWRPIGTATAANSRAAPICCDHYNHWYTGGPG